jgi:hypothetical protein
MLDTNSTCRLTLRCPPRGSDTNSMGMTDFEYVLVAERLWVPRHSTVSLLQSGHRQRVTSDL